MKKLISFVLFLGSNVFASGSFELIASLPIDPAIHAETVLGNTLIVGTNSYSEASGIYFIAPNGQIKSTLKMAPFPIMRPILPLKSGYAIHQETNETWLYTESGQAIKIDQGYLQGFGPTAVALDDGGALYALGKDIKVINRTGDKTSYLKKWNSDTRIVETLATFDTEIVGIALLSDGAVAVTLRYSDRDAVEILSPDFQIEQTVSPLKRVGISQLVEFKNGKLLVLSEDNTVTVIRRKEKTFSTLRIGQGGATLQPSGKRNSFFSDLSGGACLGVYGIVPQKLTDIICFDENEKITAAVRFNEIVRGLPFVASATKWLISFGSAFGPSGLSEWLNPTTRKTVKVLDRQINTSRVITSKSKNSWIALSGGLVAFNSSGAIIAQDSRPEFASVDSIVDQLPNGDFFVRDGSNKKLMLVRFTEE